jgi:hypothetical protein
MVRFIISLVANVLLLIFTLLYRIESTDVFLISVAAAHIALFVLNLKVGTSWPRLLSLCSIHIVSTYFVHQFYTLQYFWFHFGSLEGRKYALGWCVIDTLCIIALLIVWCLLLSGRYCLKKKSVERNTRAGLSLTQSTGLQLMQSSVNGIEQTTFIEIPQAASAAFSFPTYLDPVLDGILSVLTEEERIQYDPDMVCSIYINAVTGEIEPTVSF